MDSFNGVIAFFNYSHIHTRTHAYTHTNKLAHIEREGGRETTITCTFTYCVVAPSLTDSHAYKHTTNLERKKERQTERQTDRPYTHKHTHTHIHTHTYIYTYIITSHS